MAPPSADVAEETMSPMSTSLVLRFRDLVTESGATVSEHRRLIRQHGHAWWGWWARQSETVPRDLFVERFPKGGGALVQVVLFDSGLLEFHKAFATRVVVAPSVVGLQSPELAATPDYYSRGLFPAWFRLEQDIEPIDATQLRIVARPTLSGRPPTTDAPLDHPVSLSLEDLRDDRPTLWVAEDPS